MKRTIIRVEKDKNFSVVNNNPFQKDPSISWKAKGILITALTMPDDWTFNVKHFSKLSKDGRDSTYSGFKELRKAGYINLNYERDKNGKILNKIYVFHEKPNTENPDMVKPNTEKPNTENPDMVNHNTGFPDMDKPDMGFPDMGNPDLLNTNNTKYLKKLNTNTAIQEKLDIQEESLPTPEKENINWDKKEKEIFDYHLKDSLHDLFPGDQNINSIHYLDQIYNFVYGLPWKEAINIIFRKYYLWVYKYRPNKFYLKHFIEKFRELEDFEKVAIKDIKLQNLDHFDLFPVRRAFGLSRVELLDYFKKIKERLVA